MACVPKKKPGARSNKRYRTEDLERAVDCIKRRMRMRRASKKFHIPMGTLSRKAHDKHVLLPGHQPVLTIEEESIIVANLIAISQWGFPFDLADL